MFCGWTAFSAISVLNPDILGIMIKDAHWSHLRPGPAAYSNRKWRRLVQEVKETCMLLPGSVKIGARSKKALWKLLVSISSLYNMFSINYPLSLLLCKFCICSFLLFICLDTCKSSRPLSFHHFILFIQFLVL